MGTKTSVVGLTFAANHVTAARAVGHDLESLRAEAKIKCDEAVMALRALLATMQGGDGNITAINTLITNLS